MTPASDVIQYGGTVAIKRKKLHVPKPKLFGVAILLKQNPVANICCQPSKHSKPHSSYSTHQQDKNTSTNSRKPLNSTRLS